MGASAAEVCATVTAGRENRLVRTETVECAILHIEGNNTNALTVLHYQVQREVFDEEVRVMAERLAIECVEKSMSSTISGSCATICLTTLAILERLTTKCTLVDLSLLRS